MKPRLCLIAGRPVEIRQDSPQLTAAREKFGRGFAHESRGSFLRHPELVLSRWGRRADYFNLDPHKPRPAGFECHFRRSE